MAKGSLHNRRRRYRRWRQYCCLCTVLLVTRSMPVALYLAHLYIYISPIKYMAYIPHLKDISVSGTHLEVTCEVDVTIDYIVAVMCKISGLYVHITCWLLSHICNVVAIFVQLYISNIYMVTLGLVT